MQLGITWKSKLLVGSLWTPFYLAQLMEYHCGLVRTHVGNVGVTEGQFGQIAVMLVAYFCGGGFYDRKIVHVIPSLAGVVPDYLELSDVIITFIIVNSLFFAGYLIFEMLTTKPTLSGKLYALWGANPIVFVLIDLYLLDSTDEFAFKNAAFMIMGVGLIFTLITTKVIISTMAHMHVSSFQIEPFLFVPYFYLRYFYHGKDSLMLQKYSYIITFVVILALYLKFVRTCIMQITNHLGIYCFSIKKPKGEKED